MNRARLKQTAMDLKARLEAELRVLHALSSTEDVVSNAWQRQKERTDATFREFEVAYGELVRLDSSKLIPMDVRYSVGISDARIHAATAMAYIEAGNRSGAENSLFQAEAIYKDAHKLTGKNSACDVLGELLILRGELDVVHARLKTI